MAHDLDPYVILELPRDASDAEVEEAVARKLLRSRDPDRRARINAAYESVVVERSGTDLLARLITKVASSAACSMTTPARRNAVRLMRSSLNCGHA